MNFKEYVLIESKYNYFKNDLGYIQYSKVIDKYEFEDENSSFWNKANNWIQVDMIEVNEKRKGNGKLLIKQWIETLPKGTGIVLNANPQDDSLTFLKLQNWYISLGFMPIGKGNISLYMVI